MTLLTLLLACDPAPEVPPPPAEPLEEEIAAPTSPGVASVELKVAAALTAGEPLPVEVAYTLPDACWSVAEVLDEPEPLRFVFTISHTRREGMCAQVMTPKVVSMAISTEAPGAGSLTVIVDGQTLAEESFTITPTE